MIWERSRQFQGFVLQCWLQEGVGSLHLFTVPYCDLSTDAKTSLSSWNIYFRRYFDSLFGNLLREVHINLNSKSGHDMLRLVSDNSIDCRIEFNAERATMFWLALLATYRACVNSRGYSGV